MNSQYEFTWTYVNSVCFFRLIPGLHLKWLAVRQYTELKVQFYFQLIIWWLVNVVRASVLKPCANHNVQTIQSFLFSSRVRLFQSILWQSVNCICNKILLQSCPTKTTWYTQHTHNRYQSYSTSLTIAQHNYRLQAEYASTAHSESELGESVTVVEQGSA